jgi:hypothetical protein
MKKIPKINTIQFNRITGNKFAALVCCMLLMYSVGKSQDLKDIYSNANRDIETTNSILDKYKKALDNNWIDELKKQQIILAYYKTILNDTLDKHIKDKNTDTVDIKTKITNIDSVINKSKNIIDASTQKAVWLPY